MGEGERQQCPSPFIIARLLTECYESIMIVISRNGNKKPPPFLRAVFI